MKKKKIEKATDGGSNVALRALLAPGGTHDRRKKPRAAVKSKAIKDASE